MIFLGAGASKIFGIKTLQEMSKDLVKIMKKEGFSDIVGKITSSLKRFGMATDFEAIYSIVEGLTNPKQAVEGSGPFTAYVCKELKEVTPKQNLMDLLRLFKIFLLEECKLKHGYHKRIESVYDRLFKIIKDSGATERRYIAGVEDGKEPSVNVGYTIATTNYDMIVELYHRIKRQRYADGFRQIEGDPFIKQMDLTTYSLARERWLIKLHGSIWQYKYWDNIFKTIEDPKTSSIPVKIEEEMIIYPTGEKTILKDPYYDFYNIFKMQRWEKLIAIGYSFRDDPVNYAIIENLKKTLGTLIVVNPNPEKVIKNLEASRALVRSFPRVDDYIIPVKGKFGDEEVFDKLEVALKVDNRERYFARLGELRQEMLQKRAQSRMQAKSPS